MNDLHRLELIHNLQGAEAGSRDLDALIHVLIHPERTLHEALPAGYTMLRKDSPFQNAALARSQYITADRFPAPRYTTSLDEALKLVPDGNWWEVRQVCSADSPMRHFGSRNGLFSARTHASYGADGFTGEHDKPAIALCIAALKAMG